MGNTVSNYQALYADVAPPRRLVEYPSEATFDTLPLDILLEIIPLLNLFDILALTRVNYRLRQTLTAYAPLWQALLNRTFAIKIHPPRWHWRHEQTSYQHLLLVIRRNCCEGCLAYRDYWASNDIFLGMKICKSCQTVLVGAMWHSGRGELYWRTQHEARQGIRRLIGSKSKRPRNMRL